MATNAASRTVEKVQLDRAPLLADNTLTGAQWCARHSALIDEWLTSLLAGAVLTDRGVDAAGISLVADLGLRHEARAQRVHATGGTRDRRR